MTPTSTGGSRFRVGLVVIATALALTASIIPVAAKEQHKVPLPTPRTNVQPYVAASSTGHTGGLSLASGTVTAASNGLQLPQATINVTGTLNLVGTGGYAWIDGVSYQAIIAYTGLTATTLTGCTLIQHTGAVNPTMATGDHVSLAFQAGASRRMALVTVDATVSASGSQAYALALSTLGGVLTRGVAYAGVENHGGTAALETYDSLAFHTDPSSYYAVEGLVSGAGSTINAFAWEDLDF